MLPRYLISMSETKELKWCSTNYFSRTALKHAQMQNVDNTFSWWKTQSAHMYNALDVLLGSAGLVCQMQKARSILKRNLSAKVSKVYFSLNKSRIKWRMNQLLEKTMTTSISSSVQNAQIVKQSMRKRLEQILSSAANALNFSVTYATNRLLDPSIIKVLKLCATWNQTTGMICEHS
jgi:hypothetical protein